MTTIETLQTTLSQFGNLSETLQRQAVKIGKSNFLFLSPDGKWCTCRSDLTCFGDNRVYQLDKDYKEPKPTYRIGERFMSHGKEYLLCRIDYDVISMICLESGNRAYSYAKVKDDLKITETEMDTICIFSLYHRKD